MSEPLDPVFRHELVVPAEAVDGNGHVNNVVYVQWMQDVATRHSEATGGTAAVEAAGATWVVRSHAVEYRAPAFEGERIRVETWVADLERVRSQRRYRFVRIGDERELVRGATDWVCVDRETGRPMVVPDQVRESFTPIERTGRR